MAKAKTAKAVKAAKVPETVYISEADQYLFAQGTHYDIYKKLGAHQSVEDGKKGMSFAVWAPHAASVFVIGTFNSWNETANQMEKLGPGGIYKTFIPDVGLGELYKFLIITPDGRKLYKADPFANQGRYVRELLLLRQILPILNGRTASGLKKEARRIRKKHRLQFMSVTSVPG